MELCVLPETGASDAIWPIVIVTAVALIVAGGVLLRSGAARRRIATGMAALAIVSALALGSVVAAPSAHADASPECSTAPATPAPSAAGDEQAPAESELPTRPEPTIPEIRTVTPEAPTAAAQCGLAPAIAIPTQEGVDYAEAQEGSTLTVTATPQPGFVLAMGATSTWTFDLTPTTVAEMPVALPERIPAFPQFESESPDVLRLFVFDATVFADLAAAEGIDWTLVTADEVVVTYDVFDPATSTWTTDVESIPWSASLAYDAAAEQLVLTIVDGAAFQASFEDAQAAVEARHPGAEVNQSGFPELGLALETSFVPGPGCAPEVATVPVLIGLV